LLEIVKASGGRFVAVEEDAILPGQRQLARRGLFVEPTSAIVWEALTQVIQSAPDPVVAILTGSGLKAV
jgi:threonine synthase